MSKSCLFAAAVLFAAIFPLQHSFAGPLTSAEVTKIINRVAVIDPAAGEHPATIREVIKDDLGLQTGPRSRSELLFQDNTLTRIGAETFFSFKTGTRDMTLEKGSMLLQVPKGLGGAKIHTAAVTAAITGTTIMMEYIPGKYIKVLVLEGSLRLSRNGTFGDSLMLRPGKMVIMKPDAKKIPDPVDVDLKHIVKTSTLVNFPDAEPLPSMDLIQASIDAQDKSIAKGDLASTNLVMGHGTDVIVASDDQLQKIAALTPADVNGNNSSSASSPSDPTAETGETLLASAGPLPIAEPTNENTEPSTVSAPVTESAPPVLTVSLTDTATSTVASVTDTTTSPIEALSNDSASAVPSPAESATALVGPVASDAAALVETLTAPVAPVLGAVTETTTSLVDSVTANGVSLTSVGSVTESAASILSSVTTSTSALPSLSSVTETTSSVLNSVSAGTGSIPSVASIVDTSTALVTSAATSTASLPALTSGAETTTQILNAATGSSSALPIVGTATQSTSSVPATSVTSLPISTATGSAPVSTVLNSTQTMTAVPVASSTQLLTILSNTAPSTGGGTVTVSPTTVSGPTVAPVPTSSPAPVSSTSTTTAPTVSSSSPTTTLTSSAPNTSLTTLTSVPTTLVTGTSSSTTTKTILPSFGR